MSERQTYFQQLSPREADLAWTGMSFDFQRIEEWHKAARRAHETASGSQLAVTDAMTKPHQVSHLIGYLIHTAIDHLHALKALITDAGVQHTFAPYTLIRGAIEAASTSLWLLHDADPLDIARRALTLEYTNLGDQRRATKSVDPSAGYDEDRLEILRDVLNRNHMTVRDVKDPVTVTTQIQMAAKRFGLTASYLTWQMCSAAAHGRPWAQQFLTLFEAEDDDGLSETLSGQLSSNQLALALSLHTACEVLDKALTVRDRYSRNPDHPGTSFTPSGNKLHVVNRQLFVPSPHPR